ncbi:MAG: NAD(+)/NADH kinase [Kiritimatiellaeota bacterium]|nr:NAD(+)/NADH kinase [Kiritimatiellota bacterium]
MKRIGLVVNFQKRQAVEEVKRVASLAAEMGFDLYADAATAKLSPTIQVCDVQVFARLGVEGVVVLGGDGTMLEASHTLTGQGLPMMGLNMGSLGYLTSVENSQFTEALQKLREDRFTVSNRTALAVRIVRKGGGIDTLPDALNEAVVDHGARAKAVELELLLDEKPVASFLCDGIIVATPTGSTAYSLSSGGPIVLPDAEALVVNVICPHTLTFRPLVVRDTTRVAIRVVQCPVPMVVSSDGRDNAKLNIGDCVEVARSNDAVPVIELSGYNPYDVLRRKLRWGQRGSFEWLEHFRE